MTLLIESEDTRYDPQTNLCVISTIHTIANRQTLDKASLTHMHLDLDEYDSNYCTLLETYSKYEDYDEYTLKKFTDYTNYDFELVLISQYTYNDLYSITRKEN